MEGINHRLVFAHGRKLVLPEASASDSAQHSFCGCSTEFMRSLNIN
eukprot:SAG11_NODE_338_length_10535_cov_8.199885_8_plen_46_part_00